MSTSSAWWDMYGKNKEIKLQNQRIVDPVFLNLWNPLIPRHMEKWRRKPWENQLMAQRVSPCDVWLTVALQLLLGHQHSIHEQCHWTPRALPGDRCSGDLGNHWSLWHPIFFQRNDYPRWWFQIFFIFIPTWGNDPIWLIFFRWVETTN